MEAVHADADAFHLGQLGVVLLKHNVLCAELVALVDDGLNVHNAGADLAEILVVRALAEAVPRDEHVRVVDGPQVDRGIGGLGEVLLMDELQAVAEAVHNSQRVHAAAHCPERIKLKADVVRVGVVHDMEQDLLAVQLLELVVVVVDEELDAVLGELLARPVVVLAALHQLVIAGVEICGLAEVLRADLRVVRDHRVDGLLVDGADVAADEVRAGLLQELLHLFNAYAEAYARVCICAGACKLKVLIADLCNLADRVDRVFFHFVAHGIKLNADFKCHNRFNPFLSVCLLCRLFHYNCTAFLPCRQAPETGGGRASYKLGKL